jgi:S1-C subfamily serine protease
VEAAPRLPLIDSSNSPLTAKEIYAQSSLSIVTITTSDITNEPIALGSGFCVTNDGLIVTNLHVVEGSSFVQVSSPEGWDEKCAGFTNAGGETDLVLLKVNHSTRRLKLDIHFPDIGTHVFAIGNPEGFRTTISDGIVSGRRRLLDAAGEMTGALIQTTAAISHGSSGGPLISDTGAVIGVTSSYWAGGQNINFAIPSLYVQSLLDHAGEIQSFDKLPERFNSHMEGAN